MTKANLSLNGTDYEFDVIVGSEGEVGVDFTKLRTIAKAISYDPAYGNTGSCSSEITFINGEQGILRYRGYSIEDLAENATFEEVMYLLVKGELPKASELKAFKKQLAAHAEIPAALIAQFDALPKGLHPMAALSSIMISLSAYYPVTGNDDDDIVRLLAKMKALVALGYRRSRGEDFVQSKNSENYVADFVEMMFGKTSPALEQAFDQLLILHADHEQNCSASAVRMVGSSQANIYASIAAGINALWGPLHGGANQKVIEMLEMIENDDGDASKYLDKAKDKSDEFRLMGFGHRVYKNFDPRARIIKVAADEVLDDLGIDDEALDIAKKLEQAALEDPYFKERKLYPNVDFYSGIIYKALGIPTGMFTVMFALGRLPGWIAQWKEWRDDPKSRIHRPRQIYTGPTVRKVPKLDER